MRFLMYKMGDESVPFPALTPEQMVEMGKVSEAATKAGVLVLNAGMTPSSMGAKVVRADGEITDEDDN